MHGGEIWVIDDDHDDHEIVRDIVKDLKLPNKVVVIRSGPEALQALIEVEEAPFIIVCDVNLPLMDGFELRETMLQTPSKKFHSVPFIFWSTFASEDQVSRAYDLSAHGFFIKEGSWQAIKEDFTYIIQYWQKSKMPAKRD